MRNLLSRHFDPTQTARFALVANTERDLPVDKYGEHPAKNRYYVVSLRLLDPAVPHIQPMPTTSYREIEVVPWGGISRSTNGHQGAAWAEAGPDVVQSVFFPHYLRGNAEVVAIGYAPGPSSGDSVESAPIPHRIIPAIDRRPGTERFLVKFSTPEALSAYYSSDRMAAHGYINKYFLGLSGNDTEDALRVRSKPDFRAIWKTVDPQNFAELFEAPSGIRLRYSMMATCSFYDYADPVVCVPLRHARAFEKQLFRALDRAGFTVHTVPFLEPIISNWFVYGFFPVLA